MERGILLHGCGLKRVAILESEYRLVLRAMILVDAPDVGEQRHSPDEQQKKDQADAAIDQVENDLAAKCRIYFLELGGGQQRQILVHEDEERQGDNNVAGGQPSADGSR